MPIFVCLHVSGCTTQAERGYLVLFSLCLVGLWADWKLGFGGTWAGMQEAMRHQGKWHSCPEKRCFTHRVTSKLFIALVFLAMIFGGALALTAFNVF